jgi:hypothetical protein
MTCIASARDGNAVSLGVMHISTRATPVKDTLSKLEFIARGCGMSVDEFLATPLSNVLRVTEPYRIGIHTLICVYQALIASRRAERGDSEDHALP